MSSSPSECHPLLLYVIISFCMSSYPSECHPLLLNVILSFCMSSYPSECHPNISVSHPILLNVILSFWMSSYLSSSSSASLFLEEFASWSCQDNIAWPRTMGWIILEIERLARAKHKSKESLGKKHFTKGAVASRHLGYDCFWTGRRPSIRS